MQHRIIQDHFRYHYRLHLPGDHPVPATIEAKPFWDAVLTETFVRHLRVPVNYWEQVLSRFPASPHDPNRTSAGRISQLLIQRRLALYPVRHLDQHQGQAAITPPVVPGENGISYQLAPASVLLVGTTPPKTKSFDSKDAAAAFITGLNLNESQLRGLAQSSNLPVSSGQPVSSLMTSLSQALLDGKLVVIIRQSSVTPLESADSASTSSAASTSKPVSLGPHDGNENNSKDNSSSKGFPVSDEEADKVLTQALKDQQSMLSAKNKELETWDSDAKASFKTWFGTSDDSARELIKERIEKTMEMSKNYDVNNFKPAEEKFKDAYAYVNPSDSNNVINLGDPFWTAAANGTDSKAGVLSHEMSHFNTVGSTDDYAYGADDSKQLAKINPTKALNNADNFEYYVENAK